jgi:adenylate cyclase class 2
MKTEIEAKFLEINSSQLREHLHQLGAVLVYPERLMVRETFDYPNNSLREIGGWVRLRNEGDIITLSYKQLNDRSLHGTKEVEVEVNNYNQAKDFLLNIGLIIKSIQETKRELWRLDTTEITIDTWPWIPAFCEVEGPDETTVKHVATQLGLDWTQALHGSVEIAYQHYYDVTDEEIWGWKEIKFVPVPESLEAKRKVTL